MHGVPGRCSKHASNSRRGSSARGPSLALSSVDAGVVGAHRPDRHQVLGQVPQHRPSAVALIEHHIEEPAHVQPPRQHPQQFEGQLVEDEPAQPIGAPASPREKAVDAVVVHNHMDEMVSSPRGLPLFKGFFLVPESRSEIYPGPSSHRTGSSRSQVIWRRTKTRVAWLIASARPRSGRRPSMESWTCW